MVEATGHTPFEVAPEQFKRPTRLGVQFIVLLPKNEVACSKCGDPYPETLNCCPNLVKLAAEMYLDPRYGASTRRKALEFLAQERRSFLYWLGHAPNEHAELLERVRASDLLNQLGL